MMIDDYLPEFDFKERHSIRIAATVDTVFRALKEADLCESWVARFLFRLRGLPTEKLTLADIRKIRFETLGETANKEILIGLIGKFWTIAGDLRKIDRDTFKAFDESGYAKAVWNFSLDEDDGATCLKTETRIRCLDAGSRASFGRYWMFIRPFSGLIRMEILKIVKRKAEMALQNQTVLG